MVFVAALLGAMAAAIIMIIIYLAGKRVDLWESPLPFRILAGVLLTIGFFRFIVSLTLRQGAGLSTALSLLLFGMTFSIFAEISKIIRQLQEKSSQE